MSKRRAIISYDKLTIDQKKQILRDFPDGYINHLTSIKTPTGDVLDALIWETEEVIYLVKITKVPPVIKNLRDDDDEDDDNDFDDEMDKNSIVGDDMDDDSGNDDDDDGYDKPDDSEDDDSEDDENY